MAREYEVKLQGGRELRAELKKIGMQKSLTQAHKRVVNEVLVPPMQERAQRTRTNLAGNPTRMGSRAERAIRGTATQTKAFIAAGGKKTPWMMGHIFGSSGRYPQFPPAVKGGYVIYPVLSEKRDEVIEEYWKAIDETVDDAFPKGGWF